MKRLSCIIAFLSLWPSLARAQVLRQEYLKYEFDTAGYGFDTPEQLGRAFFKELQDGRNLKKFFGSKDVFDYMIVHAGMKHQKTAMKATDFYWQEFEGQRDLYCQQLLDNLDHLGIDMKAASLSEIRFKVEQVNDTGTRATDIELQFDYEGNCYSIFFDDCGQVKGKWFLMTPYVLWQGKAGPESESTSQ